MLNLFTECENSNSIGLYKKMFHLIDCANLSIINLKTGLKLINGGFGVVIGG